MPFTSRVRIPRDGYDLRAEVSVFVQQKLCLLHLCRSAFRNIPLPSACDKPVPHATIPAMQPPARAFHREPQRAAAGAKLTNRISRQPLPRPTSCRSTSRKGVERLARNRNVFFKIPAVERPAVSTSSTAGTRAVAQTAVLHNLAGYSAVLSFCFKGIGGGGRIEVNTAISCHLPPHVSGSIGRPSVNRAATFPAPVQTRPQRPDSGP